MMTEIVDLNKAFTGELHESEYLLKPFDMVYVPKTKLAKATYFVTKLYEFIPPRVGLNFQYVLENDDSGRRYIDPSGPDGPIEP